MEQVGIYEVRNELSQILHRVEAGEEFMITNRGREVAVLTSPEKQQRRKATQSLTQIRQIFAEQPPGSLQEMMAWAKEGQR